jgi:pimeloyl-ACP methyl ester carboxylesterase
MPRIAAGDIQVNYESYGQGDPLLLIMGFGMPGIAWVPLLPFLSGFGCIYFDNRGTGNSDKPEGPYTIPAMADDASNLLKSLGIAKAKVYGVSMGGMIAQELVLRHPEQVEKLVLGCTMPGGSVAVRASDEVYTKLSEAFVTMPTNPEQALDDMMPLLFPVEFIAEHPDLKSMMLAGFKMFPPTPPESIERTEAAIDEFDAYDRLPQIKCPVMIVHGEKDVLVPPENASLIKARIPHAETFIIPVIPEAGHSFSAADPAGIHQRIVSWLKN